MSAAFAHDLLEVRHILSVDRALEFSLGFIAAFVFAEIISLGGLFSDLEWGYVLAFAFFIVMMFIRPAGLLARRS